MAAHAVEDVAARGAGVVVLAAPVDLEAAHRVDGVAGRRPRTEVYVDTVAFTVAADPVAPRSAVGQLGSVAGLAVDDVVACTTAEPVEAGPSQYDVALIEDLLRRRFLTGVPGPDVVADP